MSELAPTLVIRRMTADDLEAVIRIDQLSFPTPWSRNTFQHEIHDSLNSCLLVGERAFPYREIVKSIVAFEGRRRPHPRR